MVAKSIAKNFVLIKERAKGQSTYTRNAFLKKMSPAIVMRILKLCFFPNIHE
jgi:hypothetical protein